MSFQQSPGQADWRSLLDELSTAAAHIAGLQTRCAHAAQQSDEAEGRLRTRIQGLETAQRIMQGERDALRRENEELKQAAREHVCAAADDERGAELRRLRDERDAAQRELRHAIAVIHDLSGRLVLSPSPEPPPSDHFEARREYTASPTRDASGPSVGRSAHPSAPPSGPSVFPNLHPSPRGQSSHVKVEDLGSEDSEPPIPEAAERANDAEGVASDEERSDHSDLTNVTYEDQVPRQAQTQEAGPPPDDNNNLGDASTQETDEPEDLVPPNGWEWMFVGLPASSQVRHGPMSDADVAEKLELDPEIITEWHPLPSRRVMIIHNDVALYLNPTYIELRQEPRRTVVVNWGGPDVNRVERRYIWPEGTAKDYHTFILAAQPRQVPEWWYVGKLRWIPTRRVPPWPTDPQLKLKIASRMGKKWGVELTKEQIVTFIEERALAQLSIELVSNAALAEESRRFTEEILGVPPGQRDQ